VGWGHGFDWSVSGCGQVAGLWKSGSVSTGSIKCGEILANCGTVSFSGMTVLLRDI
jgi:hypothetical protein